MLYAIIKVAVKWRWAFYNMKSYNNLHNYNAFVYILYIIYNDIFVKEEAFLSKKCSFINSLQLILVLGKVNTFE